MLARLGVLFLTGCSPVVAVVQPLDPIPAGDVEGDQRVLVVLDQQGEGDGLPWRIHVVQPTPDADGVGRILDTIEAPPLSGFNMRRATLSVSGNTVAIDEIDASVFPQPRRVWTLDLPDATFTLLASYEPATATLEVLPTGQTLTLDRPTAPLTVAGSPPTHLAVVQGADGTPRRCEARLPAELHLLSLDDPDLSTTYPVEDDWGVPYPAQARRIAPLDEAAERFLFEVASDACARNDEPHPTLAWSVDGSTSVPAPGLANVMGDPKTGEVVGTRIRFPRGDRRDSLVWMGSSEREVNLEPTTFWAPVQVLDSTTQSALTMRASVGEDGTAESALTLMGRDAAMWRMTRVENEEESAPITRPRSAAMVHVPEGSYDLP